MTKSSPLLLLVATLCLVIAVLAAFWIGLMPQRLLANLSRQLKMEQGLILEAKSPRMGFDGGPVLKLQAVSMASDSGFDMTARDVQIDLGYAALFGGKPAPLRVDFGAPVITLDMAKAGASNIGLAPEISVHDAVIRLKDSRNGNALALSDINGKLTLAGNLKLDVSFLQNGNLTTLSADIESAERFADAGSPADITLASREKILSFSGRAKLKQGLELDGQMSLEGAEAQTAFAWLGMPFQALAGAGEIKLTSGVSTQALEASLSKIVAQIGGQDLAGQATVKAGPDRVGVKADITMPALSLLPNTNPLASPWSEVPFSTADLSALNADINLNTENLILRQYTWGPADLSVNMAANTASLDLKTKTTTLNIKASPTHPLLGLEVDLQSTAADAKTLFGGLLGFDMLSGPIDLSFKATASGNTAAAVASTLKGRVTVTAPKLNISSIDVAAQLATPGEGWQTSAAATSAMGVAIDAEMTDGIAALTKADLILPSGIIKLKGEVDLLRQAFDLRATPKGKVQAITGTWTRPLFAAEAGVAPPLRPVTAPAN
jgi:AsmA-like C-terminal region